MAYASLTLSGGMLVTTTQARSKGSEADLVAAARRSMGIGNVWRYPSPDPVVRRQVGGGALRALRRSVIPRICKNPKMQIKNRFLLLFLS